MALVAKQCKRHLTTLPAVIQYYIVTFLSDDDYLSEYGVTLLRYLAGGKYAFVRSVDSYGNTYRNNKPHSYNDKPAVVEPNGNKYWCYNGIIHRVGGPALYDAKDQVTVYYLCGKIHNDSGPAKIHSNGDTDYYINGLLIKKEKYTDTTAASTSTA